MRLTAVVAVGSNGVIGRDGQMPWPPTGDMRLFKELTWGHPMIMGRATFESIGKPLPGRTSIVMTRNPDWDSGFAGVIVVSSLAEAIEKAEVIAKAVAVDQEANDVGTDDPDTNDPATNDPEVFLIGGGFVFTEAREAGLVDRLVVTHVPLAPEGDAFFDPIEPDMWEEVARELHTGTPDFEIVTYERRR